MSSTRIYVVKDADSGGERLIRSYFGASAIRHATRERFSARKATVDDLERLITAGIRVEHAVEPVRDADDEPGDSLP